MRHRSARRHKQDEKHAKGGLGEDTKNNSGENKERQSEKHSHQRAMQNTRHSEMAKAV